MIAPGIDVPFPSNGLSYGIVRSSLSTFVLPHVGLYSVQFQVTTAEPGKLCVAVNGVELPYTVVLNSSHQLTGTCLVRTHAMNSTLNIRNPVQTNVPRTLSFVSGYLVVIQIA